MSEGEVSKKEKITCRCANLCKMLSNPKRLAIFESLRDGEKSVGELVSELDVRQANLSQHLAELRKRDLVVNRKKGTNVYYSIAYPKIVEACEIVREIVYEQLSESRDLVEEV